MKPSSDDPDLNLQRQNEVQTPECEVPFDNYLPTEIAGHQIENANALVAQQEVSVANFQTQLESNHPHHDTLSDEGSVPPQKQLPSASAQQVDAQHWSQEPQQVLRQPLQCHYPVPTYPQGYVYAPQHRAYYAIDVMAYSSPSHLLASFGSDTGAVSISL